MIYSFHGTTDEPEPRHMTDGCRVLMFRLLDSMDAKGYVSEPRSRLAADLGVDPSRISERIGLARKLGLLDQVRRGRPGVTAVYVATFPTAARAAANKGAESAPLGVRPPVPSEGAESAPQNGGLGVRITCTHVGNGSREPNGSPVGYDRNGPSADAGDRGAAQAGGRGPGEDDEFFSSSTATPTNGDVQGLDR